ncbi:MAG: carbonic anhydrase [Dehalococcoidia bacterium]
MTVTDDFVRNNEAYAATFDPAEFTPAPKKHVAVVTCMDARIAVFPVLGLQAGDAHIIRNAGGIVTDDVLRSLLISQRSLGTREIVLMHHSNCGLLTFTDDELAATLEAETGQRPTFPLGAITDLDASVRDSMKRLRESPFLVARDAIRGFVFDVQTGRVREVV